MSDSSTSKRQLRLVDAIMIILGSMIGSGIFLAPSLIARIVVDSKLAPGSFVWIWIVGGLLTLCAALSFAELASALPHTGGQYVYLSRAFSPFWGFLYGWTLFTVIQSGFIAAVSVAFANYLGVFFKGVSESNILVAIGPFHISAVQGTAILLILILSVINSRSLNSGSITQNILGFAKAAALLALIAFGLGTSKGDWSHFQPLLPQTVTFGVLTGFGVAMSKALFAYDSWNVVTFVAEQTENPTRTLPRALFLGTLGVILIYALVTSAYLHVLPLHEAATVPGQRIAATVGQLLIGPAGATFIAFAVLISTAGCVNGLILSGPWLYYAMAKDGLFFRVAAKLGEKHHTPVRSTQLQAVWAAVLILWGSFGSQGAQLYSDLLTFTSFASLLFNFLTVLGLFALRKRYPDLPRPYRVFAYPLIPILYLVTALFFLVFIAMGDPINSGGGLIVILSGIPLYLFWRRAGGRGQGRMQEAGPLFETATVTDSSSPTPAN